MQNIISYLTDDGALLLKCDRRCNSPSANIYSITYYHEIVQASKATPLQFLSQYQYYAFKMNRSNT